MTTLWRAASTDREVEHVARWSPEGVADIRRIYVDDAAVAVALSERISKAPQAAAAEWV